MEVLAQGDHAETPCVNTQVLDIGIGQRYGIILKRPQQAKAAYSMRASTMTHQTYQGAAILVYGSNATVSTA